MAEIEHAARDAAGTPVQPVEVNAQPGSALSALRALGVIFGGPLVVVGASVTAVAAGLIAARRGRLGPTMIASTALGAAFPWIYDAVISPRQMTWGAARNEIHRKWPGDDIIPSPAYESLHAVTISAPASQVWPWLLQIGENRGGFFSYDWLENLSGADIHTIQHIVPELQHEEVGDPILLSPNVGLVVWELVPERALVLRAMDPNTGQAVKPDIDANVFFNATWSFILDETSGGPTRLIARFRADGNPRTLMKEGMHYLLETPHFIMERKMLLNIKKLAEQMSHA